MGMADNEKTNGEKMTPCYSFGYRLKQRRIWLRCIFFDWWLPIQDKLYCLVHQAPTVVDLESTLQKLIKEHCSVARYGDGEMQFVRGNRTSFQEFDPLLQCRLTDILKSKDPHLMVCLPGVFGDLDIYRDFDKAYWRKHLAETRPQWYKYLDMHKTYYEAFVSRFYMPYRDKSQTMHYIELWRKVWEGKDLLIVEGEKSRLGVGNDLFDNAREIKRVLCPNMGAFAYYQTLLNTIRRFDTHYLILLAIGPTATVLAADLCSDGYQAIDIGHIDIEYSWFLMGAKEKVVVNGKFVNEAEGGRNVGDCNDEEYCSQVVAKFV